MSTDHKRCRAFPLVCQYTEYPPDPRVPSSPSSKGVGRLRSVESPIIEVAAKSSPSTVSSLNSTISKMFTFNIVTALALASLLSTTEAVPVAHPHAKRAIGATLRPTNQPETCIGVSSLANGAFLFSGPCNQAGFYNKWDVSPGDNQVVKLSGLPSGSGDWCLDAGLDFTSGTIVGLKIWQCYPGVPQQR